MLTVAHALSGGYCAIIMPEGIGHQDSQLRHLRTGSMRSAINAASIAISISSSGTSMVTFTLLSSRFFTELFTDRKCIRLFDALIQV